MSTLTRFIKRILQAVLRDGEREAIIGDLNELFVEDEARHGHLRATLAVVRETLSLTARAVGRWIVSDRALQESALVGTVGGALLILTLDKPLRFLSAEALLILSLAAIIRLHDVKHPARRFATVLCGYSLSIAVPLFVVGGPVSESPGTFLRWCAIAIPSLGGVGLITAGIITALSSPRRFIGLAIASIPVLTFVALSIAGLRPAPLVAKLVLPLTTWGPIATRGWNSLADIVLWSIAAFVVSSLVLPGGDETDSAPAAT